MSDSFRVPDDGPRRGPGLDDPWSPPDPESPWTSAVGWSSVPRPFFDLPGCPTPGPAPEAPPGPDLRAFAAAVAWVTLLGAPVGLLWVRMTPKIRVAETAAGLELASPEGKEFFNADGWFLLISIVAGLVSGGLVWLALRRRGPAVPLGLAVGSLIAASVARSVGGWIIVNDPLHRACTQPGTTCPLYDGTLHVRATGALVVWAVTALILFTILTAFLDREEAPAPRPTPLPAWPPPTGGG